MSRDWGDIKSRLVEFLRDEARSKGFNKGIIGLSGGIDSALSATLAKEAFGEGLYGVLMPSKVSSQGSIDHAKEFCEKFDIKYEIAPINKLVDAYFADKGKVHLMRIGNFSARMRMATLYDVSFRENALVIGTSNRSEIILGYGTIYGDVACALNPIGSLYKSEVFEFAEFVGVPKSILSKKPSAELYENQEDEQELGYTYKELDEVMKLMFDEGKSGEELQKEGFNKDLIEFIQHRYEVNRFKCELPVIAEI
ncbi:MAG: NAD+ synthase [Campylobacterales bacterium]